MSKYVSDQVYFCNHSFQLEHDDVFSTMQEKQYFLVIDDELDDNLFSLENTPEALNKLILKYLGFEFPSDTNEFLSMIDTAYKYGRQSKQTELTEFIDELKSVISDYD